MKCLSTLCDYKQMRLELYARSESILRYFGPVILSVMVEDAFYSSNEGSTCQDLYDTCDVVLEQWFVRLFTTHVGFSVT